MTQVQTLENGAADTAFADEVKRRSGVNLDRCYQCFTCTLGCPFYFAMDFSPNQMVRMVQLGLREKVLSSTAIWFCASCQACATRCPHDVDIPRVMDTLRQMSLEAGVENRDISIPSLHRTFLNSIKRRGRQYELGILLALKLKTGEILSDLRLGLKMLLKGKLPILPPEKTREMGQIRKIFKNG